MIKLLYNQKVNNKKLSKDGFKCSKKMLYPIIDELMNITKFKSHRYSLFEPPVFMN